jgi:hypothetical protein
MSDVVAMTLRVPEALHPRIRVCAARAGVSVNAWIVAALAETVELEEEEHVESTRQAQAAPAATA